MNEDPIQLWRSHAMRALKRLKHSRDYAADEPAELALAAVASGWQEKRADVGKGFDGDALAEFFEQLAELAPELRQQRPNDAVSIPAIPVDEITGERAINSWLTGDLTSQAIVEQRFPALAAHLKKIAANKGFSFAHVAEIQDAEAAAREQRERAERLRGNRRSEDNG